MNTYLIQYSTPEGFVPASMKADNVYDALAWTKENIQPTGVCVTLHEPFPFETPRLPFWF